MSLTTAILMMAAWPDLPSVEVLAAERVLGSRPSAVIVKTLDFDPDVAVSFYAVRTTTLTPSAPLSGNPTWIVRRLEVSGDVRQEQWSDMTHCSEMGEALTAIERLSLGRIELTPSYFGGSPAPAPNMGPLHVRHKIWLQTWNDDNVPNEVILTSSGAGDLARIMIQIESDLADCWTDTLPVP